MKSKYEDESQDGISERMHRGNDDGSLQGKKGGLDGGRSKLKFKLSYVFCLAGIIGIFIISGGLRERFIKPFLMIGTMEFSAVKLFSGMMNQRELLSFLVRHFTIQLLFGYVASSLLILISVFFLYYILRDIPALEVRLREIGRWNWEDESCKSEDGSRKPAGQDDDAISQREDVTTKSLEQCNDEILSGENAASSSPVPVKLKLLFISLGIIIIVLMVLISIKYLSGRPVSTDEFAYYFQANVMKNFRLTAPAPKEPEFFGFENIIIENGKWYSKYTIGFPLFLALGILLRFPLIVNPLFSIIAAIFLFLLTQRLFGSQAAFISVFLAFLSPFFFLNGAAGFQPHISLASALLGAGYFFFLSVDKKNWHYPVICAIFFTVAALIRPIDAALWGLSFFLLSLYFLITRKDRISLLRRFMLTFTSACAGIFIILLVNRIQTGDFLKFAFQQYQQREVWGFASYGHNIYKGLWNVFHYQARLISWSVIFMLEGALISFFGKEQKKVLFLWFIYFIFVFFFFGWYAIGHYEYGPRYLFTGFVYLLPASAYGLTLIFNKIGKSGRQWRTALLSYLIIQVLFTVIMIAPTFVPVFRSNITDRISWLKLEKRAKAISLQTGKKAAIFIANAEGHKLNNGTRNIYPVNRQDTAYFLLLEPERDLAFLRKFFPEFEAYVAFYDPISNDFRIDKFPNPETMSADQKSLFFMFTGLTYRFTLEDREKAMEQWEESYRLNNNNLAPLINIANLLMDEGKNDEAKKKWEEILKKNPDISAAYESLGRIHEIKGENKEAGKYYMEYLRRSPDSPDSVKIREKILYYKNMGRFP